MPLYLRWGFDMAIVTVHSSFGDDKFPLKAVELPQYPNHVYISATQLWLVCPDMWCIHMRAGNDGKEYGVFHRNNVNFQ